MANQDFTCAEVAKLVRSALREGFPGVKFSVTSHVYSLGSSIDVCWIDGPNEDQVALITKVFETKGCDSTKRTLHALDGQPVRFRADHVTLRRVYTDKFVDSAISNVYAALKESFELHGIDKPTVEAFNAGTLINDVIVSPVDSKEVSLQHLVRFELHNLSNVAVVMPSATLARVKRISDDAKEEGSGHA